MSDSQMCYKGGIYHIYILKAIVCITFKIEDMSPFSHPKTTE